MRLEIACREHAAHDVLEDMLLDGIEAVLFASLINTFPLGHTADAGSDHPLAGKIANSFFQERRAFSKCLPRL
jgi:hypothetical protein